MTQHLDQAATDRWLALLRMRQGQPFSWGLRDCFIWAADAVQALTGTDPAADLRGRYTSARGALRTARANGGFSSLCAQRFGPALDVRDIDLPAGAVVLLPTTACTGTLRHWGGLAVVAPDGHYAVAQGSEGLVATGLDHVCAWIGGARASWQK